MITDLLVELKIAESLFHAAGMLNVLECVKMENDEQRIARCQLYTAWKNYYKHSKEFKNEKSRKAAARANAIAGLPVSELPMLKVENEHNPSAWQNGYDDAMYDGIDTSSEMPCQCGECHQKYLEGQEAALDETFGSAK